MSTQKVGFSGIVKSLSALMAALALLAGTGAKALGQVTFAGNGNDSMNNNAPLNASVTFSITNGTDLRVSLENLGPPLVGNGALMPSDALTVVYFSAPGIGTLTAVSALTVGTEYNFPATGVGSHVGDAWDYASGLSGPGGGNLGISAAGFNGFGAANFDPANPTDEQNSVDGFD